MKKMNILLVAFTLVVSAITPMASSAETLDETTSTSSQKTITENSTDGETTELSQSHASHYTINIPPSTTELEENDEFEISATTFLEYGKGISVSVTSKNTWKLTDTKRPDNNEPISYKISVGERVLTEQEEEIFTVPYNVKSDSVTLVAHDIEQATYAGTYSDTLTFTVNSIDVTGS